MDQPPPSNWRARFERGQQQRTAPDPVIARSPAPQPSALDDGHHPARMDGLPLSAPDITERAALALADDTKVYRPWILQRGVRPVMMLNLRRFDLRSGLWSGHALPYPYLCAVEYVGAGLVSLDFGTRQFMLEGHGLTELVDHLQTGTVISIQEFAPSIWPAPPPNPAVLRIRPIGQHGDKA